MMHGHTSTQTVARIKHHAFIAVYSFHLGRIYAALFKDRWLFVCAFCLTHFQVSRPSKHVDNVDGLVTDGSCVCCQLCVSQLYQNKKLGPQLRLAVTV